MRIQFMQTRGELCNPISSPSLLLLLIVIACIASLFFATQAKAQTTCPQPAEWNRANVCWTNATQNTDDTPIATTCPAGVSACGKLALTRIEYGTCVGTPPNQTFGTKVGEIVVAAPASQLSLSALVPQMYCLRGFHKNDVSNESVASGLTTRTVKGPTPKAPVLVQEATAFDIRRNSSGALVAQRIGVVRPGTQCYGGEQQVVAGVTYTQVPRDSVDIANFSSGSDLWVPVVYAKCG